MKIRVRPLLRVLPALVLALSGCGRERPPNVLLVTFDTTRADFLGCYGKTTAHTPHLDRLAAQGFLFEHAYSSNPVTQAAHSTILTGVYPMVHGVRDNIFFHLPEKRRTLAELLKAEGYGTAAAIGGFPLTREFGTAQGFDHYDDDLAEASSDFRGRPGQRRFATWYDERPAGHVNDAILPWLRERRAEPFFVWLHYWDPHEPHIAPAPYGQLFANDPYQGEIAYADESLGAVLRELEKLGELERTLVVMAADHGEGRQEHREMTHAFLAYDTTLHVPLIMRVPGRAGGRRIAERVGTVDVVPTILELVGAKVPEEVRGRSLVALMNGRGGAGNRRPYYSESMSPRLSHGFGELRAFFVGPWKYIHGPRPELFQLDDDPRELHDLAAERPEDAERMRAALAAFLAGHASAESADAAYEAGEETRRRLSALGYLSGAGDGLRAGSEELRDDGAAPQDRVGDVNLQMRLRRQLGAGQFRAAEAAARQLLERAPGNAYLRASLVSALLGLGETEEAARWVEETETFSAANVMAFLEVAGALVDNGDPQRGLALARRLVAAEETADTELALARMLRSAGDAAASAAALSRALELDGEHRGARLEQARQLIAEGSFERADEEIRRLLAEFPVDVEGHLAYARLLRARGRGDAALDRLRRVLRLAPGACEAHRELVSLLAELGRREEEAQALDELRDRCPDAETGDEAAGISEEES